MKNRKLYFAIAVLLFLVLCADYYFIHLLFPMKKAAIMKEINKNIDEEMQDQAPSAPAETK